MRRGLTILGLVLGLGVLALMAAASLLAPMWQLIAVGVAANIVLLAIILAAWTLFQRLKA